MCWAAGTRPPRPQRVGFVTDGHLSLTTGNTGVIIRQTVKYMHLLCILYICYINIYFMFVTIAYEH